MGLKFRGSRQENKCRRSLWAAGSHEHSHSLDVTDGCHLRICGCKLKKGSQNPGRVPGRAGQRQRRTLGPSQLSPSGLLSTINTSRQQCRERPEAPI